MFLLGLCCLWWISLLVISYSSAGMSALGSGIWSQNDWQIQLSGSTQAEPRIVRCNGILCLVPDYRGVDAPLGVLLRRR
jgi:hypothetical protein